MSASSKGPALVRLPIGSLVDNPRNPRHHPESQLEQLAASYKKNGQPRPILARKANNMLIAGHGLRAAMVRAGATEIDVLLWDVDQKQADAFMLGDNELAKGGKDDKRRIAELLAEIDKAEFAAVGFSDDAVAKILEADDDIIAVQEIETRDLSDKFWISLRGPLRHQAKVLKIMRDALKGAGISDVAVELGTIAEAP